jgi:hypothetical protein
VVVSVSNDRPRCDLAQASPSLLWPPNHRLVPINIIGVSDPNNDTLGFTVTGVTQDEPTNGQGDGSIAPDAVIQGNAVHIRAERSGSGDGRVYRINFTAYGRFPRSVQRRGDGVGAMEHEGRPRRPWTAAMLYDSTPALMGDIFTQQLAMTFLCRNSRVDAAP